VKTTVLALALMLGTPAFAEPPQATIIPMGTVAPEGTSWARELRAFQRYIDTESKGTLAVKIYLGGIAGDELQAADRVARGQLDAIGWGGMLCQRHSPTMRALHVLARTREESAWALDRLKPVIEEEVQRAGYRNLGGAGLGPDFIFAREPVRSLDDLRRLRLSVWDLDEVVALQLPALGGKVVLTGVNEARKTFDEGRVDGFVAIPTAALAFQWSAATRYVTDLRVGILAGCVIVRARAMDSLSNELRDVLKSAGARMAARFEDIGRTTDAALLGGAFAKQGVSPVPASAALQAAYESAAAGGRARLVDKLVPRAVLDRVAAIIDDYPRTHPEPTK
jgi:TRAP-type C4-dicarboxylate transport system substrate-binding protein